MATKSITEILLGHKKTPSKIRVLSSRQVVRLDQQIYIGRTPGRFVEFIGHQSAGDLSIKDALDELDANRAAENVFPLAATPGSHWIYFALFSTCSKTPGRYPLKQYLYFLKEILNRPLMGVAAVILNEGYGQSISGISERARNVHDIRIRITNPDERKTIISERTLRRIDNLVRSARYEDRNYRQLATKFRYAWLHQSEILRANSHHVAVQDQEGAPDVSRINNDALLRIYSVYWLIRALYGIEIGYDDQEKAKQLDALKIRDSAKRAQRYLTALFKLAPGLELKLDTVLKQLRDAERTGDPPLIREYYKKWAAGERILNGFRLPRFLRVLRQLNASVKRGLNENL